MIAHQPQHRVGPVLAARNRRVARAFLAALGCWNRNLRLRQFQAGLRIFLGVGNLLAGELAGQDRVEALDSLRGVTIGDRLHFERV